MSSKSIFRYAGDSYPITVELKVNGVEVSLDKAEVHFFYDEVVDGISKKIRITGTHDNRVHNKIKFLPREQYSYDETNGVPVTAFTIPGNFEFSIVRTAYSYSKDADNGMFVFVNGTYEPYVYNNPDHTTLARFARHLETATHAVGMIEIASRL